MTSSKPTAGFWITVALVAVLVVYPLSYGPWIGYGDKVPEPIRTALSAAFEPIRAVAHSGYSPEIYQRYVEWWLKVLLNRVGDDEEKLGNGGSGSGPDRKPRLRRQAR